MKYVQIHSEKVKRKTWKRNRYTKYMITELYVWEQNSFPIDYKRLEEHNRK